MPDEQPDSHTLKRTKQVHGRETIEYLTYDERYWSVDIETDGLLPTVIWCMCAENIVTREIIVCTNYEEMRKFFDDRPGIICVGHNFVKYDAPWLNTLAGTKLVIGRIADTLVMTTLYSPNIAGGHSLDAWGERLGVRKAQFNDWTHLSPEMIEYCKQDVKVTAELYRKIVKVLNKIGFSELTCYIQHQITGVIQRQHKNGFKFDGQRALLLYQQLRLREEELQDEIRKAFPAERRLVRERNVFTKSGSPTALYLRDREQYAVQLSADGSEYRAFEDVPFNIGSPKQRVEKLTALGWVADEKTPKGQPKLTEKSAVAFAEKSGIPEVALLTKWMSVNGRANMINTWLNEWNEDDECIHGKLFVADTLRFRHQAPNTANIPAVRVDKTGLVLRGEAGYYTYEARDLWTARPGRVLVGTDAAGLELRMLAHYLNRPDFTKQVVERDPHQYNPDLAGVPRPRAKTLLYAIQYGAQAGKVAQIIEGTRTEGAAMREQFLERLGIE